MKKKYLGLVAAAMLGIAPVAGVVISNTNPTVVQASDDNLEATLWLKKKTPYLVAKNGESVESFIKRPIRDVTSNVGKVTRMVGIAVYPNMDNGDPDYTEVMSTSDTLRKEEGYSAVVTFRVSNGHKYARLLQDADFDLRDHYIRDNDDSTIPKVSNLSLGFNKDYVSIVVPVKVVSSTPYSISKVKTAKVKHNAYIYTKNGKRALRTTVLKKNHTVKVIKTVKIKNKKYAQIGKNQFVKWTNLSK